MNVSSYSYRRIITQVAFHHNRLAYLIYACERIGYFSALQPYFFVTALRCRAARDLLAFYGGSASKKVSCPASRAGNMRQK
jgi:hypothetical protein